MVKKKKAAMSNFMVAFLKEPRDWVAIVAASQDEEVYYKCQVASYNMLAV